MSGAALILFTDSQNILMCHNRVALDARYFRLFLIFEIFPPASNVIRNFKWSKTKRLTAWELTWTSKALIPLT